MPYPAVAVFMVERANERQVTIPPRKCCDRADCDRILPERVETHFDIIRPDTGEVLVTDVEWMTKLPPGAMFWQEMTGPPNRPTGEDDWSGYSEDELQRVRDSYVAHPQYYTASPTSAQTGLPRRSQSHLFADGPHLHVVCPNGQHWNIDSRASNCTMPYDYEHRCWVRHGEPPNVHVDKNGHTCAAGAGSIMAGDYHGFLHNGVLTAG